MQARDKSGKTLDEFLRDYDVTKYFRPSVTVDAILYSPQKNGLKLLLIRRGGHPFLGDWAFPGGFVEEDEACETAALRELEEETGVAGARLKQLVTVSTPGRDPRWRNITVVFCAESERVFAKGGDDAAAAQWFDCAIAITKTDGGERAELTLSADGESFCEKLDIIRDDCGKIDLNRTTVTARGGLAFDHAKIVCYLFDELRGEK